MPDIDFEALNFLWVVLAALGYGIYKTIAWIVNVNRDLKQIKIDTAAEIKSLETKVTATQEKLTETRDDVKTLIGMVNQLGGEVNTRFAEILQTFIQKRDSND